MSEHNPFIICKASAGSGKTFSLVREFLRLSLAGDEAGVPARFHRILAITFTNKAANEMKDRIMVYLDQLSDPALPFSKTEMGAPLLEAINAMEHHQRQPLAEADLRRRASTLRTAILHHYSDLSVSTIDSFMHRVVRTFAHDLDRPVNFDLMIEHDELIEHAVSDLMSLVGTEGHDDLTEAVRRFAVSRMENEKGFNIESSLTALAAQLFSEGGNEYVALLKDYTLADFMEIYRRYTDENRALEHQVQALGREALSLLASASMDDAVCNQGARGFLAFFNKAADGLVAMPNAYTVKVFEAVDYSGASLCKAKTFTPAAEGVAPRLREIYFELNQLVSSQLVEYNTRKLLLANLYSVALLGELDKCLAAYSSENEVLHISEFNKLINKVVLEQDAPFIYERLGSRYTHFLIDEFQDTSILQWQNLMPLLANGLSQNADSFVVGDGKQAIYRFRQGDVQQFIDLPAVPTLPRYTAAFSRHVMTPLQHNRRTCKAVVDFNNDFFSWIVRNYYSDNKLASKAYLGDNPGDDPRHDALFQTRPPERADDPEGCVDITFTPSDDPDVIAARVLEIVTDVVENHGFNYSDIMVLCRTHRELAAVNAYMREHSEVQLSSAESFFLRKSHAVMAMVAAMRCLADPADRIAQADLLVRLRRLGVLRECHLDAFTDPTRFDLRQVLLSEGIDFRPDHLLSLDLYDLTEHLLRLFRLDGIDTAYVASLLNRAAAFVARHKQSLADFLRWFDDHPTLSAIVSDAGNAVGFFTIHKAKGLERPVVICPFISTRERTSPQWVNVLTHKPQDHNQLPAAYVSLSKDTSTLFDDERDQEASAAMVDKLNVLYVALTRPRERLYLVAPEPSGNTLNYSRMIASYLERHGSPCQAHTVLGNPDSPRPPLKKKPPHAIAVQVERLSCPDWTSMVHVASPSERAVNAVREESIRFGTYAHELLADIRHAADADNAIARFLKRQPVAVPPTDLERLRHLVHGILENPQTAIFFSPDYQAKNEATLLFEGDELRPDRIVITPDETWVVDFKTGKELESSHSAQVLRYCRALQAMGYPRVSGWLLYTEPTVHLRPVSLDQPSSPLPTP